MRFALKAVLHPRGSYVVETEGKEIIQAILKNPAVGLYDLNVVKISEGFVEFLGAEELAVGELVSEEFVIKADSLERKAFLMVIVERLWGSEEERLAIEDFLHLLKKERFRRTQVFSALIVWYYDCDFQETSFVRILLLCKSLSHKSQNGISRESAAQAKSPLRISCLAKINTEDFTLAQKQEIGDWADL